ncbi:asparaginase [Bacillus sp. V2I10]|uniref:asparaginase n=1 Tax=Bacillus sp. V2I10 TaxID=3042276 RepID=UPI00278A4A10|nr:asparaginase [Bacillus sp. V2I10]MDQ0858599.1 L-asparaginase [Bacillus sp. V2I10]
MKHIFVIHTGGTISMSEDETTGEVKQGESNPLLQNLLKFNDIVITAKELFYLPSPHITPKEMLELKETIEKVCQKDKIDGIVITHGTDTLEETAYFLDLTLNVNIPVVITGAMRSSNELGSDGLYNLVSSIQVAASKEAAEMGVLVVMNDEVHSAKNATKTHTSNVATFQSPQYGPIGIVNKRGVAFHHKPVSQTSLAVASLTKQVLLLKAYAGMDETILKAIEELKLDGLVIEALGQGNLPPKMMTSLKKLMSLGVKIVIVSRCFNGIVQDVYAYEGGGKTLKDAGIIFSNGLNGQKARLKLMIALETTQDAGELQEIFSF